MPVFPAPAVPGARAFIVAMLGGRYGTTPVVAIREFDPVANPIQARECYTRESAWARAKELAYAGKTGLQKPLAINIRGLTGDAVVHQLEPLEAAKPKPTFKYVVTLMVRKGRATHTREVEAENKKAAIEKARAEFTDATTLVECERVDDGAPVAAPVVPAGTHAATRPQGRTHHAAPARQPLSQHVQTTKLPWE